MIPPPYLPQIPLRGYLGEEFYAEMNIRISVLTLVKFGKNVKIFVIE